MYEKYKPRSSLPYSLHHSYSYIQRHQVTDPKQQFLQDVSYRSPNPPLSRSGQLAMNVRSHCSSSNAFIQFSYTCSISFWLSSVIYGIFHPLPCPLRFSKILNPIFSNYMRPLSPLTSWMKQPSHSGLQRQILAYRTKLCIPLTIMVDFIDANKHLDGLTLGSIIKSPTSSIFEANI